MKKRFLAIVLTLVMALALAVPSFAAITMPTTVLSHELLVDEVPNYIYDSVISKNWNNSGKTLLKVLHHSALLGYVNIYGGQTVQEKYTNIGNYSAEGLAWAMRDGVAMYVNTQGAEVISLGMATPREFSNGRARVTDHHGNTYYIDTAGNVVFNLGQSTGGDYDVNGLTWIRTSDGRIGIVNKAGQEVGMFHYNRVSTVSTTSSTNDPDGSKLYYNSGLLRAERYDANCGRDIVVFLDTNGVEKIWITDPNVVDVHDFSYGMAMVRDARSYQIGYIDTTGWLAVYCQYEDGTDFTARGIARIRRGGKYGYVRYNNTYAVQPMYDYLDTEISTEGLVVAGNIASNTSVNPAYNFITINKYNPMVNPGWDNELDYHYVGEEHPVSGDYGIFGYVNVNTGAEQIPLQYHVARPFSEGYGYVSKYGTKGFVDATGTVRIYDTFYDQIGDFYSGRAWASKNGKYGFIDKAGNLVISAMFDIPVDGRAPYDFQGNICLVRFADFSWGSRYGIITTAGNWAYSPIFSDIIYFNPQVDEIALFNYQGINNAIVLLTTR